MKFGVSTYLYANENLTTAVKNIIKENIKAIKVIELFCERPQLFPMNPDSKTIEWLRNIKEKYNLEFSLHVPCYDLNPASRNPGVRKLVIEQYTQTFKLANSLDTPHVVVHSGHKSDGNIPDEEALELAIETLRVCQKSALEQNVKMLVENTGYGSISFIKKPDDLRKLVDGISESVGIVIDTGHAHLQGLSLLDCFDLFGKRIIQIHVNDNYGDTDSHLPIGNGDINFCEMIKKMKILSLSPLMIIEIYERDEPILAIKQSIEKLKKFEELEY